MPTNKKRHTLARQWELLKRLPARGAGKTASDLAKELNDAGFEVSKRQVERDLGELMDAFALECNNASIPYGWRWVANASADLPGLSIAEALSLRLVEDTLRSLMPAAHLQALEPRFRQAKRKLEAMSAENPSAQWLDKVHTVHPTQPLLAPAIDPEVLATVQEALFHDRQLEVSYRAGHAEEASAMRLHPLALVNRGQVTYLVATAWDYQDVRLYALHRISQAARLEAMCTRPKDFDLEAYIASGALQFGNGTSLRLKARLADYLVRVLTETPLSADQRIEEGVLTATVQDTWQLLWWILGQGQDIEVLEPEDLRRRVRERLERALAAYADSEAKQKNGD